MRPVQLTVVGATASTPFLPDIYQNPFQIGIGVSATGLLGTTNLSWAIEHCFDYTTVINPLWNGNSSVTWFQNSGLGGNSSGTSLLTANGNYAFAVAAIRLNVYSAGNATTVVTANFIQSVNSP